MTLHSAVSPVVALFLVSWSIGAYEERRRAVLGLTLLVSGLWVSMAVDMLRGTDHYAGTDFPWIGALVLAPGVLGIAFGARTAASEPPRRGHGSSSSSGARRSSPSGRGSRASCTT